MVFNVDKCKIMHVGRSNPQYEYKINEKLLKAVEVETDVGAGGSVGAGQSKTWQAVPEGGKHGDGRAEDHLEKL
jgi:hypothetical protein